MVTQRTDEQSGTSTRPLLLNNLVAALVASTLMIFLHELAHLVTHLALGHSSTLYPFGVIQLDTSSERGQVVMLLAGPVFSLVTGLLMQLWTPLRARADLLHLMWLWFAFVSVQEGITYLCLTPFGAGDTGQAAQLLGLPVPLQFVAFAIGIGGMFLNARAFAPHMARHAGDNPRLRNAMTLFPWLYGMAVSVLLSILYLTISPAELPASAQIAILAAGTSLLVFAPMAHIFSRSVTEVPPEPLRLRPVPIGGLVVLAVLVAGNIMLSFGLSLG
ncbi:hypothetical protein CFK39_11855 [Brachybacterium avium]|uniref:Uncharacterized protein n=1 Tax=Brachybacterium avium TaxID=2017485 RepID=A0A220UER4_9MICO|nr:hypothetical protein [Brachybacterium avium]ASK66396.1 hypothetical protein CFK39_11855 [Brachybacterium avium]